MALLKVHSIIAVIFVLFHLHHITSQQQQVVVAETSMRPSYKIKTIAGYNMTSDANPLNLVALGTMSDLTIINETLYVLSLNRLRKISMVDLLKADELSSLSLYFETIVGYDGEDGYGYVDGYSAKFSNAKSLQYIPSINTFFISDANSAVIRNLSLSNIRNVGTVIGGGTTLGNTDFLSANIGTPNAIYYSKVYNLLFIADSQNYKVWKANLATNQVTLLAGNGNTNVNPATVNGVGAAYIPIGQVNCFTMNETTNQLYFGLAGGYVYRIDMTEQMAYLFAGGGGTGGGFGLPPTDAMFTTINGLYLANNPITGKSEMYISDLFGIRVVDMETNILSKFAGIYGAQGYASAGDGDATHSLMDRPSSMIFHSDSSTGKHSLIAIDGTNNRIRRILLNETIGGINSMTTIAGINEKFNDIVNTTQARLNSPTGLFLKREGNQEYLFLSDSLNHRIRKINLKTNFIETVAGTGDSGNANGDALTVATFNEPRDLVGNNPVLGLDLLLIADYQTSVFRSFNMSSGMVDYFAQSAMEYSSFPTGAVFSSDGQTLYFGSANKQVNKLNISELISTVKVAGSESKGYSGDGGSATSAELNSPSDLAFNSNGDLLVCDSGNNVIRKVNVSGIITNFAGINQAMGTSGDGGSALLAQINTPVSIAISSKTGDLFIAQRRAIRRVDSTSMNITTIAGALNTSNIIENGENIEAIYARLINLEQIFLDELTGQIYLTDSSTNMIRRLDPYCTNSNYALNEDGSLCLIKCFGKIGNETCSQRGSCVNLDVCSCQAGYFGSECQYVNCTLSPCLNGGSCISESGNCSCLAGYSGLKCETNLFKCHGIEPSNPLVCSSGKGTCTASDTCSCLTGYFGEKCQYNSCFQNGSLSNNRPLSTAERFCLKINKYLK